MNGDKISCTDPLKELEKQVLIDEECQEELPFQGGAIGYVGYDVAACYEDIGEIPKDELNVPDLQFYLYESYVIYDKQKQITTLVVGNCYSEDSEARLEERMGNLEETLQQEIELPEGNLPPLTFTSNFSQDEFEAIVRQAKKRIVEGGSLPSRTFATIVGGIHE
ncbi:MAG: hypothetical protein L0L35_10245, partial [Enterococcus sp.]|nr:hypothetical protein [Enterococcus sp.]